MVEPCEERVILRDILIRNRRTKIGKMQITQIFPVDSVRGQFEITVLNDALNVSHSQLTVPASIDVNDERP
jgi:hypothetical protein